MEQLRELYRNYAGKEPANVQRLPGAGSNRAYYRFTGTDGKTIIGVVGTSQEENHAFVYLARFFKEKGINVPEVYAVSDDEMRYLQQDLGSRSLYDAIKRGREAGGKYNDKERLLIAKVLTKLSEIHHKGMDVDWSQCYPAPEFDKQGILFDLNYFKYCFLKPLDIDFNEYKLQADFEKLASDMQNTFTGLFMYRDFQSRNVMLDENDEPYFIDFQGGRRGAGYYDLVSFLWQASAKFSDSFREHMLGEYLATLRLGEPPYPPVSVFYGDMNRYVLARLLQVLGAYGFRGYFERKKHFLDSIPPAIDNLKAIVEKNGVQNYPYLEEVCKKVFAAQPKPFVHDELIVRVFSFSYKKGLPQDVSGNGGGYYFDCRGTNNPGRYPEYQSLTGLDQPVIDYLEKDGEILQFLDNVYPMVDFHVQRWIDRGFKDLMISFGCTGGQHRSVYSAQHVAEHIHEKFGVKVQICHREQNIYEELQ